SASRSNTWSTGSPRSTADGPPLPDGLARLEVVRHQLVATEQLVEIGAVALGKTRRLADVAAGDLQDLRQVAARELLARLIERGQFAAVRAAERLLHQFH